MRFFEKKIAVILTVCLILLSIPCGIVMARGHVEVDKGCTIIITVPDTMEDLNNAKIDIALYRIATIDRNGYYTVCDDFSSLAEQISSVDSDTTADDWSNMANDAREIVDSNLSTINNSSISMVVENGSGLVSDVPTGLYLVYAKDTKTDSYGYKFTPYIVSAPNNEYAVTGSGSDEWNYDNICLGLKPEQYKLVGDLEIVKTLKTLNASMGTPLFVFDIEATNEEGKVVFSDVVSISFDGAGRKKVVVKNIPAGTNVTVTEVYSGASYDATSAVTENTKIVAEDMVSVNFTNNYNDKLVYSTGVVNHFEYDGNGWEWHQITDNE